MQNNISFLQYSMNNNHGVDTRSLNTFYKLATLDRALSIKLDNPKTTKKDVAKQLNISEKTLQRYSSEINEEVFQKRKQKTSFKPSKCHSCDFVSKNTAGMLAHTRAKHIDVYISYKESQFQSENNPNHIEIPSKNRVDKSGQKWATSGSRVSNQYAASKHLVNNQNDDQLTQNPLKSSNNLDAITDTDDYLEKKKQEVLNRLK